MFGTYRPEDVTILLKNITGQVEPLPTGRRERLIQSGVHYSEMLPLEYEPTKEYLDAFFQALRLYAPKTADAVQSVANQIRQEKQNQITLVSLARAGTPVGILIKHDLERRFQMKVPHYTISIIRGKGIDRNAMNDVLRAHPPESIQFVDGWTGKGAIQRELNAAMENYPKVDPGLAVLSDPGNVAGKAGSRNDFLIASSLLNSTVSGLLSRTFYRSDIIGQYDYHGAAFYQNLIDQDLTYVFISKIEEHFRKNVPWTTVESPQRSGLEEVREIAAAFGVQDINLVKPGIGEATRVLLRRVPWKLLVHSLHDDEHLGHLYLLAKEKQVEVIEYPLTNYRACGIIRQLADT